MKYIIILVSILFMCPVYATDTSGYNGGDLTMESYVIRGNDTDGLSFDPDNDLDTEIVMNLDGTISTAGLVGDGANPIKFDPDDDGDYEITMNIDGTLTVSNYTLPAIDGSADQVLTTDGIGGVTWEDGGGGELNDLSDVTITTPVTDETLIYNDVTAQWENGTIVGGYWTQDGSDIYYTTGNVGIGIATPQEQLHIEDSKTGIVISELENTSSASASVVGALYKVTNDSAYWGGIGMTSSGSTIQSGTLIDTFHLYNQGYGNTLLTVDGDKDFVWYTDPTDSHNFSALGNEVMRLTSDGNVGIGTATPSELLDVNGKFIVDDTNSRIKVGDYDTTDEGSVPAWSVALNTVAQYNLNDNVATTTVIDEESAFNGTLVGGNNTSDITATGIINSALHLSGTGEYVTVPVVTGLAGEWTVAGWFNSDNEDGDIVNYICGLSSANIGLFAGGSNATFSDKVGFYTNSTYPVVNITINEGTWYHVILEHSSANLFTIRVRDENGVSDLTDSTTNNDTDITKINLGAGGSNLYPFDGLLDHWIFIDRLLTTAEEDALFNLKGTTEANSGSASGFTDYTYNSINDEDSHATYARTNDDLYVGDIVDVAGNGYIGVDLAVGRDLTTGDDIEATGDIDSGGNITATGSLSGTKVYIDNGLATSGYSWDARTSVGSLPAVTLRPTNANENMALDIIPNGSPSAFGNNGLVWVDILNEDCLTGDPTMESLRLGIFADHGEIGMRRFSSGDILPLYFTVDAVTKMTIDADGEVGIGTTSPASELEVNGITSTSVDADTIADSGDGNPATATLTPTTSYVELTCNDSDTCDITMGETNMNQGADLKIVNVGSNVCDFSDSSGVSELAGDYAMGQYDSLTLKYTGSTWFEIGRSDN